MRSRSIHDDPSEKGVFIRLWVLDLLDNDYPTALLFNQLLWWHQPYESGRRKLDHERDGKLWLLRADDEWVDARLSVKQVRRARGVLLQRGLIEHRKFRRDGAPTSAWRPLFEVIQRLTESEVSTGPAGAVQSDPGAEVSTDPAGPLSTDPSGAVQSHPGGELETDPAGSVPIPFPDLELPEKENLSVACGDGDPLPDDQRVFDAWRVAVEKPRSIFDVDRRNLVAKRLKEHPVDVLVDAVRGWRHDPFYCGANDRGVAYNDLAFLLKNASRIEKFSGYERGVGRPAPSPSPAPSNGKRPNHQVLDTDRHGPSGRIRL